MLSRVNITNPDGSKTLAFESTAEGRASEPRPPWDDADPAQAVSSAFAAQLAVYLVLRGMEVSVGSFENLLSGTGSYAPVRTIRLNHVTFDMPDSEDEIQPLSAAIIERSPQVYDEDHRPYMLKEQWKGYSLRCISKSTVNLGVAAWFGHKNERRAFRAALSRLFLAEPLSERGGRLIVVPWYFDRTVRLNLVDVASVDQDELGAQLLLQASITAVVDEIVAVKSPQPIKAQVQPSVGVGVDV